MQIIYLLTKELNLAYSDFNNMNFFEILTILQVYEEHMKEQRKHDEKEQKKMEKHMSDMQSKYNYNDLKKQTSSNYNPPTYNPPTFNMPKF